MRREKTQVGHCYRLSKRWTTSFLCPNKGGHQYILITMKRNWSHHHCNKIPQLKKQLAQKDDDSIRWLKCYRGAEEKDQGKRKNCGNYTRHVNAWFSQSYTYESDHQLYYKRTNTNISPMKHSDKHIFLWMCLGWKRMGEGRGGRKVNILYTKRNDRDHPLL